MKLLVRPGTLKRRCVNLTKEKENKIHQSLMAEPTRRVSGIFTDFTFKEKKKEYKIS